MRRRILSLLLVFALVLGMVPVSAFAADAPFTVTVDDAEITAIKESTLTWVDMYMGTETEVTCYTVTVPEGSTEATLQFEEEKQWSYYDSTGSYIGEGETSWTAATSHKVAIADTNGDGVLNLIDVLRTIKFSVGMEQIGFDFVHVDMNTDYKITAVDVLLLLKKAIYYQPPVVEEETAPPAEEVQ